MNIIKGDLIKLALKGRFDVIIHGCNCFNTMGAGIALQIKNNFNEAYIKDLETKRGDFLKMGKYTSAIVKVKEKDLVIVNGYTQYRYGGKERNVDYDAVRHLFGLIKNDFNGKKIAFPKIGCGLAGGDWNIISNIVNEELEGEDFTLVEYNG